jgi:SAM-dependent methyltransferase
MSFAVPADYDRCMGRYSVPLAPQLADFADVGAGQSALDVGCGPGALTSELVRRLGPGAVTAVDPSEPFVAVVRERCPGVDARCAAAESLPFPTGAFDVTLAQLVVHFMADPMTGLGEMRRVTRDQGVVAACVWDHAGDQGPLIPFWKAVRHMDPDVRDQSQLAGAREGHLGELFRAAGLHDVEETSLAVSVEHPSFEEWWEPFTLGVGPAGSYTRSLDADAREELRKVALAGLPAAPFVVTARAWAARGVAPGEP